MSLIRPAIGPADSLAWGSACEASRPLPPAAQDRRLFAALLTGSLALHVATLLLLDLLERAPPSHAASTIEIPVELVSAPAAGKGEPGGEKAGGPAGQAASKTKPDTKAAAQQTADQAPSASKPPQPAAAEKQTATKPPAQQAQPQQPPKPEATKPAPSEPSKPPLPQKEPPKPPAPQTEPPKPVPPQTEPPKPVAPQTEPPKPPLQAQASKPAPQAAAAAIKPSPAASPMPTMAALQQQATSEAGGQSPYGLMPDDWRAAAVPKPSDDGDQEMSYKTVVFGMLELAKQFPEDARARGANGSALIQFELNDDGTVKSVTLVRSSGDASLDVESLALVERASPFPKPPPGAQKIFSAAIEFNSRPR